MDRKRGDVSRGITEDAALHALGLLDRDEHAGGHPLRGRHRGLRRGEGGDFVEVGEESAEAAAAHGRG